MSDPKPTSDNGSMQHHVHVGHAGKHGPHDPEAHRLAETRSTPSLIGDLIGHVTELFRKELMLARAELNEKTSQVTSAGGILAGALVFGIVGLIFLAGTLTLALIAAGLSPVWAALIVGGVLTLLAVIMAMSGKSKLKPANLAPNRTVHSVQQDAKMAKERVK